VSFEKLLRTSSDSWVNEDSPGTNHGPDRRFFLNGQASHKRFGYAYFSKPFPGGALILDAELTLTLAASWAGTTTITINRIVESWKESKINYTNRPSITTTHQATAAVVGGSAGQRVTVNLTSMVADVAAGAAWYGVQIQIDTTGNKYIWTSEAPNEHGPTLDVSWALVPDAVTDLHPADGAIVGDTTPVVTWTFRDVDGSSDQESSQVQVSTDPDDFTTPVFDSTMAANTDWQQEITSGLTDGGGPYYWRVRVTDENGNVSPWSDVSSFTVTVKGTLTLSSPGTTVDETTPPVEWSLSSGTQEAYRVKLIDNFAVRNGGRSHIAFIQPTVIWDTGRVLSTDTLIHVPAGLIAAPDTGAYTLELYVWDDTGRVSTPGSPAYVFDSVTFTWVPGGPTAVGSLVATADDPGVLLTWIRSIVPDFFALRVDGDIPAGVDANGQSWDRLLPDDYLQTGTTYALSWMGAEPGVSHTYEIMAVDNDSGVFKHSTGNPTATYTTSPLGIWLVDMDTGDRVQILMKNDPSGQWSIGEEAQDYYPIGRRDPVHITTSVRGYEGSMTGLLVENDGTTAEEWKERVEGMKGRLGSDLIRLIVQGFNFPIGLGAVEISPSAVEGYNVSFAFAQVGEYPFAVRGGA
jgi:hypothetical protein